MGDDTSLCVEYAKSNRSTCRGCFVKIEKGAVRIGVNTVDPDYGHSQTAWHHLDCTDKEHAENLESTSAIQGFDTLAVDGQAAVETWFESNRPAKKAKGAASSGGGAKKAGAAGGGKQKMRRPEIGETLYQCGYALSGRAKCKACGEKIEQASLRIGYTTPGEGDYDMTAWRHYSCAEEDFPFVVSPEENVESADGIYGFDGLNAADQQMLTEAYDSAKAGGGKKKKKKKAKAKPKAAASPKAEGPPRGTYIDVPFKDRSAENLGAKWDFRKQQWFVPFDKDLNLFEGWIDAMQFDDLLAEHDAQKSALDAAASAAVVPAAAAAAAMPGIDPAKVPKMTVKVLKEELSSRGLDTGGKKGELVTRLTEALAQPQAAETAAAAGAAAGGDAPPGRRVDRGAPPGHTVYEDWDVKLNQSNIVAGANNNKFYIIQVLHAADGSFAAWNRWGRVGEEGESKLYPEKDAAAAIKRFKAKFKDKTKNTWEVYKEGKFERKQYGGSSRGAAAYMYSVVELAEDDTGEGGDGLALGKLSVGQIEKGQAVISQLKTAIAAGADSDAIALLSSQFYTFIPTTTVGRQAPPPLDDMEIIGAKEAQLLFWLKMGFQDTASVTTGNPLATLFDLPLPTTLQGACSQGGVSDASSIKSSVTRGKSLAATQCGKPTKKMDAERYGCIVLYTGNSIYRSLNQALRVEHQNVPKYLGYLRLFFDAASCMKQTPARLWRGIAADLYDEYEPGKEIVWWSVSSCTAAESVARGFMSQLGGVASLIILDTTTAMNITPMSIYPHEAESLLVPGTKLKVISRKKVGKVNEIHVEECGNAMDDKVD